MLAMNILLKSIDTLTLAQNTEQQSIVESDLNKQGCISYKTGRMPVQTDKQDAYPTEENNGKQ